MKLIQGDCLEVMKTLPDNSVDSCVTDPPYGLKFMGKKWDYNVPTVEQWEEVYRVMKPGAFLLAFGGDRTYHRMVVNIEDAGFEIRTTITWNFGSGFPKSLNVSKALTAMLPSSLRCVCAPHSLHTDKDSQSGYQPSGGLCDEQPLSVSITDRDVFPLQDDVLLHSRDDLHVGDLDAILTDSLGRLGIDLLSTEDCENLLAHLEEDFQSNGNKLSDTLRSMFRDALTVNHKMEFDKQNKLDSVSGLAFSSPCSSPPISSITRIYHRCKKCKGYFATTGIGTALKPAMELICLARKPLSEKTVAANVLKWGTGGLNIDASRVGTGDDRISGGLAKIPSTFQAGAQVARPTTGRFPANVIHDGSDEVVRLFPNTKSVASGYNWEESKQGNVPITKNIKSGIHFGDSGSAARFFYVAKASKAERGEGNNHPTVKPLKLMCYLCRLVTPPGGTVLDCYVGSGTTGVAAQIEGFDFIGIDKDIRIATRRIEDTDPLFQAVGL